MSHAVRRGTAPDLVAFVVALADRTADVEAGLDGLLERGHSLERVVTETIGAAFTSTIVERFGGVR